MAIRVPGWTVTRSGLLRWLGESRASPRFRAPPRPCKVLKPPSVVTSPCAHCKHCMRHFGTRTQRAQPMPDNRAERGFGARWRRAVELRGPLCVGIDPHPELLGEWGLTDDVRGLERFALGAVEALAPVVAVIKPQSAFFERHGARGVAI